MRSSRPIIACAALIFPVMAQDIAPKDDARDPVLSALSGGLGEEDGPSVTVDISASAQSLLPEDSGQPVLVKPSTEPVTGEDEASGESKPEPEGVTVTVEPGSASGGAVDAASVKLLAPFPAKPLSAPPGGWRLEHPKEVPAFVREVPLSNGTKISLSIRPHLLVPDADGAHVVAVKEPGYEPALRYAQTGTMSAVLSGSLERLDEDSRKMSEAVERLGQLLASLPSPEIPPEAAPSPIKKLR
jgi:hypothetical protein